jgi:NAD(P)-dependent dehydrogenase (short-subunit alcohol dehydrogenase family)
MLQVVIARLLARVCILPEMPARRRKQDLTLHGKVALVTGGGAGIGRAAALRLAEAGARVAVLDLEAAEAEATAATIESGGGRALAVAADIADPRAVEDAVDRVLASWERLDIVFANAGINGVWAPLAELEPEEWRRTLDINLTGTFYTLKYTVPALQRQGGSVIVTSSVNGTRVFSNSGATAYATSKAGQVALAKMLALELAKDRVRVNAICPGAITTSIGESTEQRHLEAAREPAVYPEGKIPLTDGAPGSPEQVAELVLFLASDASSHVTGSVVYIDGGESLLLG